MPEQNHTPLVAVIGGEITTTSLAIAEGVEMEHASVIKTIRKNIEDFEAFGKTRFEIQNSTSGAGRPTEYAVLNQHQATLLLTFMRNSPIVKAFKVRLVKEFFDMAKQLREQSAQPTFTLPHVIDQDAAAAIPAWMNMASLFNVPLHLAQIEAVKAVDERYAVDFSPLLVHAPAQNDIQESEVMLEPTELAKRLGLNSGAEANLALLSAGLQAKEDGQWVPTEKGQPYCMKHAWKKGSKSGYNLKWRLSAVSDVINAEELEA